MATREERKSLLTKQRREQILEAALEVFSARGYGNAAVPEIAARAGVAVGTIYNYFPSKKDILTALLENNIIEPVRNFLAHAKPGDETALLQSIVANRFTTGLMMNDKIVPIFLEIQHNPELIEQYRETLLKPLLLQADRYVGSLLPESNLKDIQPAVITRVIAGLIIGMAVIYRTEGAGSPLRNLKPEKLASDITTLLLNGLKK